jgi:general secretion pathway protein B
MSYILDALKRAESERERGVVPGLHSQSVSLRRPLAGSGTVAKPLMLAGAALGLVLLGVLAWRWFGPVAPGSSAPVIAISPVITSQVIAATPAVAAVPTAVSVTTAVTPNPAPLAKAIEAAQADKPPVLAASPKPEPRPAPVAAVVAKPEPAPPRIVPIGELPADIRQTLPKVVISGSTYSDNPAYRMLIINGEVFREGEKPAPDLQLEQIRAKAAVLNFKGLRYSVAY